jgi:hypothetical protein
MHLVSFSSLSTFYFFALSTLPSSIKESGQSVDPFEAMFHHLHSFDVIVSVD